MITYKKLINKLKNSEFPFKKIHKHTYKYSNKNGYEVHSGKSKKTDGHIIIVKRKGDSDV